MIMHECTFLIDFFGETTSTFNLSRESAKTLVSPGTPKYRLSSLSSNFDITPYEDMYADECEEKNLEFAGGIQFALNQERKLYGKPLIDIRLDRLIRKLKAGEPEKDNYFYFDKRKPQPMRDYLSARRMIISLASYYGIPAADRAFEKAFVDGSQTKCIRSKSYRLSDEGNEFSIHTVNQITALQSILINDREKEELVEASGSPKKINSLRKHLIFSRNRSDYTHLNTARVHGIEKIISISHRGLCIVSTTERHLDYYVDMVHSKYPEISTPQGFSTLRSWFRNMEKRKIKQDRMEKLKLENNYP